VLSGKEKREDKKEKRKVKRRRSKVKSKMEIDKRQDSEAWRQKVRVERQY